ncbi:MAG: hypothetical protein WBP47_01925, partial [Candidatus Promineifilaceae bacterium]
MTTTTKRSPFLPFLLLFALFVLILYRFSERWLHLVLLYLSKANWARQIVSKLSVAQMVAMRFVAGTTIAEAMTAAKDLNAKGMKVTLDF